MIELAAGDYRLTLDPGRGGSILHFSWHGAPLLRETTGPGILDAACFPLVPWSNRIAHGRFVWEGGQVEIPPNFPAVDPRHPLHGSGWLSAWRVAAVDGSNANLTFAHEPGDWPWRFDVEQRIELAAGGLTLSLSLTNRSEHAMPAGLGFHPYIPRTRETRYRGFHRGMWHNALDGLPHRLEERAQPCDWWQGAPVGTMPLDTVFSGRAGALEVEWPERGLRLTMAPSEFLAFTAVFVPGDTEWFCVEPVSHATDAVNSKRPDNGIVNLRPGETISATIRLQAFRTNRERSEALKPQAW